MEFGVFDLLARSDARATDGGAEPARVPRQGARLAAAEWLRSLLSRLLWTPERHLALTPSPVPQLQAPQEAVESGFQPRRVGSAAAAARAQGAGSLCAQEHILSFLQSACGPPPAGCSERTRVAAAADPSTTSPDARRRAGSPYTSDEAAADAPQPPPELTAAERDFVCTLNTVRACALAAGAADTRLLGSQRVQREDLLKGRIDHGSLIARSAAGAGQVQRLLHREGGDARHPGPRSVRARNLAAVPRRHIACRAGQPLPAPGTLSRRAGSAGALVLAQLRCACEDPEEGACPRTSSLPPPHHRPRSTTSAPRSPCARRC